MTRTLLVLLALYATRAAAYPEFVRHGYFNCASCHVSPTGGGALTDYGRSFEAEKLATWVRPGEEKPLHGAAGDLPPWLVLGGHLRQIQTYVETPQMRDGRWLAMQRDVEACLKVSVTWTCATAGLVRDRDATSADDRHFGFRKAMLRVDLGENVIVRAGRFFPRFGLMLANHTSAVRRGLGFDEGRESDQLEATLLTEKLELTLYRDYGRVDGDESDGFSPAIGATGAVMLGTASRAGVSYRREAKAEATTHTAGLFAALGLSEQTFLLAEADQRVSIATDPAEGQAHIIRGAAGHLRLGHEVTRGVVPYLLRETLVKDLATPALRQDTYGLGVQWYPRPHFEVDALWSYALQRRDMTYATAAYLLLHYHL